MILQCHLNLINNCIGRDALKALLNAMKFYHLLSTSNITPNRWNIIDPDVTKLMSESHEWTVKYFAAFVAKLDAKDWQSETVLFNDAGFRAVWKKGPKTEFIR